MAVKKIYSDHQSYSLRSLPYLQSELDELKSHTEDYYIAQRDAYNQQQRDEYEERQAAERDKWERQNNEMKENIRQYSEKYYEIIETHLFKFQEADRLIFDQYCTHRISRFIPFESIRGENPAKRLLLFDPKNIKVPDELPPLTKPEPIPMMDLEPLKVKDKWRIQELENKIEKLKTETADTMSASQDKPLQLDNDRWLYQDCVYEVTGGHSFDEICLLILEFADKERRKFERLKNKFSGNKAEELKYERLRIPEEVRIAVWRRDQGRCARCGSRENLEYDHIVPVSKGGGNTERNIELLCQDCNRAKGNRIE
jgi:hypothetical protein